MNNAEREASELLNDPNDPPTFISLFDDDADTTVARSSKAYDRYTVEDTFVLNFCLPSRPK